MKKSTRIWLIVAGACIFGGMILAVLGRAFGAKNGVYFSKGKLKIQGDLTTYTSDKVKQIQNIDIDITEMAITVKESSDDQFYFDMQYLDSDNKPEISMENNTISIKQKSRLGGFWFNFPFYDLENEQLTLYVPKNTKLDSLKLSTRNGAILLEPEIATQEVSLTSSNGKIETGQLNVTKNTYMKTSNGRIVCNGVYTGKTDLNSSNGKIICKGLFTGETTTDTSNGAIEMNGTFKGNVNCKTSNGSIEFTSALKLNQYNVTAKTSNGSVRINDNKVDDNYRSEHGLADSIQLKTSNGSIKMYE